MNVSAEFRERSRLQFAGILAVAIGAFSVAACSSDRSTEVQLGRSSGSVTYQIAMRYPNDGCDLQGPARSKLTLKGGKAQRIDIDDDGSVDGFRAGDDFHFRVPDPNGQGADAVMWISVPVSTRDPATSVFREMVMSGPYRRMFDAEDPRDTVRALVAQGRASPATVNVSDVPVTVAWAPSDTQIDEVTISTGSSTRGFPSLTTSRVADSDVGGMGSPPQARSFGQLPARQVLLDNPRLHAACGLLGEKEREALEGCIDHVPAGLSVSEWLVGRSLREALYPSECE